MAKITVQAGRTVCVDDKPFVSIARPLAHDGSAGPTEADAFTHYIAQKIDWNEFQKFLEEYKKS